MPKRIVGKEMESESDYVWDIYENTPIMSTYTIAIAVLNNYTSVEKQHGKRNITAWKWNGFNESEFHESNVILSTNLSMNVNITIKMLSFLEEYFNMTDVLPKIDSLQSIFGIYGAMENWGLIIYWSITFDNPEVIAHELTHFWAGNLVTCKNWDE